VPSASNEISQKAIKLSCVLNHLVPTHKIYWPS
jgi:hypothetical protein